MGEVGGWAGGGVGGWVSGWVGGGWALCDWSRWIEWPGFLQEIENLWKVNFFSWLSTKRNEIDRSVYHSRSFSCTLSNLPETGNASGLASVS